MLKRLEVISAPRVAQQGDEIYMYHDEKLEPAVRAQTGRGARRVLRALCLGQL